MTFEKAAAKAVESMDAVTVAKWIDRGWMVHSPFGLTRRGRAVLRGQRKVRGPDVQAPVDLDHGLDARPA